MIHFLEAKSPFLSMGAYLETIGRPVASRISIRNYDDMPNWSVQPAGTYIFAAIDFLLPAGRALAGELYDQLVASGSRALNSPHSTRLRLDLLEELHRAGMNRFRAVRGSDDFRSLRFPVFVREEHGHHGSLTPLLNSHSEVEAGLGWAIARGHRLSELLVVEFCDTSDADGLFRKYAAFIVGTEIIPRSLNYGRKWMLKQAGTEFSAPMIAEENAFIFGNPHEKELRRIFSIAKIEYGRIDYAIKDGVIQTWEINLTPTIGRRRGTGSRVPEELRPLRGEGQDDFFRRFQAALEALDSGEDGRPIPIHFKPESLRAAGTITRFPKPGWKSRIRKSLRPLRPVFQRVAEALSPILVRAARLRTRARRGPERRPTVPRPDSVSINES
jgi:hypothetical protein